MLMSMMHNAHAGSTYIPNTVVITTRKTTYTYVYVVILCSSHFVYSMSSLCTCLYKDTRIYTYSTRRTRAVPQVLQENSE